MYLRSKKSLILSVVSLLISAAMILGLWPLVIGPSVNAPLGYLYIGNFMYALFNIFLLLKAWYKPKRLLLSILSVLAFATLLLNVGLYFQLGLLKPDHWWGFVLIVILLSVNVFAIKSVINETFTTQIDT